MEVIEIILDLYKVAVIDRNCNCIFYCTNMLFSARFFCMHRTHGRVGNCHVVRAAFKANLLKLWYNIQDWVLNYTGLKHF